MAEEKTDVKQYQQKYYHENRQAISERRKRKYKSDEEYRKRMRVRDQRNYWFGKRHEPAAEAREFSVGFEDVARKGCIGIVVDNPEDVRHGEEVQVAVLGTPEIGHLLERDPQTLRKWLKAGVIPEPYLRGEDLPEGHQLRRGRSQRLYTEDEARVIFDARELLRLPTKSLLEGPFSRKVHAAFGELVQGIVPQLSGPGKKVRGRCMACTKPYEGEGDPAAVHRCLSCGFRVAVEE